MTHRLELAADYDATRAIGPWLKDALAALEAPQAERAGELELAVHELAVNIIDHAYDEAERDGATYRIDLTRSDDDICIDFIDDGRQFTPPAPRSDEPTVGGYGLMIVEQLASTVTYERRAAQNRWTLVFGP